MPDLKRTQHQLPNAAVTLLRIIVPWLIFTDLLYVVSLYNYLLFHSLAELFSIAVAAAVFMLVWNTRRFTDNNFLFFLYRAKETKRNVRAYDESMNRLDRSVY